LEQTTNSGGTVPYSTNNKCTIPPSTVHNDNVATTTFEVFYFSLLMPTGMKMFFSTVLRKIFCPPRNL
jgi:hypothetical protein